MPSRIEIPEVPPSVAILPFLFLAPSARDAEWEAETALLAAAAAERADSQHRNTIKRLAFLLCEAEWQYRLRRDDEEGPLLSRRAIARALGVSLSRIKRALALLCLSGAVSADEDKVRVLDAPRLARLADFDRARLGLGSADEEMQPAGTDGEDAHPAITIAGDPACFV